MPLFGGLLFASAYNAPGLGAQFVVGGTATHGGQSPDGTTWNAETLPVSFTPSDVACSTTTFCMVSAGSDKTATSTDGITWTGTAMGATGATWNVGWNGNYFLAVSYGSNYSGTSTDGITWTISNNMPSSQNWSKPVWNGSVWCSVAAGTSTTATSSNGSSWIVEDSSIGNISSAVYSNKSTSVSGQITSARGIYLSSDGTALFATDPYTNTVFQYTLATPWDISTSSYSGKSISVVAQVTAPETVSFKTDGTIMYVGGSTGGGSNSKIFQYTLSTPWDVSTAAYASKLFDAISQIATLVAVFFSSDGSKMYASSVSTAFVYQYTLGTPWDISTASYASKSFSGPFGYITSIFLTSDGISLYVSDGNARTISQCTLSLANDISTASYTGFFISTTPQTTDNWGLFLKGDKSSMYLGSSTPGAGSVFEYLLSGFASQTWTAPCWNGTLFCSLGQSSTVAITAPDGVMWTQRTLPSSSAWTAPCWNGSNYCAVNSAGQNTITSADGINWTAHASVLPSSPSGTWTNPVWNGSLFLVADNYASNSTKAATSPDGVTWTAKTLPTSAIWKTGGTSYHTYGTY